MELIQLRYFKAISEYKTLTKAASILFVTQSTLSKSMKSLEEELGISLFDRNGKNISLNENGKMFLKRVNNIFQEIDNAKYELSLRNQLNHRIKVGITSYALKFHFEHFFDPERYDFVVSDQNEIVHLLHTQSLDAALCGIGGNLSGLEVIPVFRESVILSVPESHRFHRFSRLRYQNLDKESISYLQNDDYFNGLVTQFSNPDARYWFKPKTYTDREDYFAAFDSTEEMFFVPTSLKSYVSTKNRKFVPITTDVFSRKYYISFSANNAKAQDFYREFKHRYYDVFRRM